MFRKQSLRMHEFQSNPFLHTVSSDSAWSRNNAKFHIHTFGIVMEFQKQQASETVSLSKQMPCKSRSSIQQKN
jgi:hypothetical protein